MIVKNVVDQLNIPSQCRSYGLSLWQCPQFLFLVMGLFIILVSVLSYLLGTIFIDPGLVALADVLITGVLFVIASVITRSFEKLAEVSRMKTEFIGIVSHQLRSPITNLKWAVEFLTSKEWKGDEEKEDEYYSALKENISRMVELVDNLLVVSRIEQDKVPLLKKEIAFDELVKDLLSRFKVFAEASNTKIKLSLPANLPRIFTDPSQIKLVVENLIDNAIRYSKGGGVIDIKIEKRDKKIYFEIRDSGVGIPEKDQKYIFQKFFRSENALKEQTRGTGLGLFIARSIIEKSGGEIGFKSKEGKGTAFYFTLPI